MYQAYERQKSRDRSRDRERRFGGRSPSEDDGGLQRKDRNRFSKGRGKRVKFQGSDDIRVFRKQDEPTARGLQEEDIIKIKAEIEKEIAKSYDFNWEHYKHRDAQLQSNSMKEQKQKEKLLSEKLMAAKELLAYTFPLRLAKIEPIIEPGCDSLEREAHTNRIHDILGCYYTHASEIPNEPAFEILNTHPAPEPKIIKFDNDLFPDEPTTTRKTADNSRPIKGILKMPGGERGPERGRSEPRQIDPQLIYLLRDFKLNPQVYTKEKMEVMLKPYRDSGELDYLTKNKEVLEAMLKSAGAQGKLSGSSQYPKESAERSGSSQPTNMVPQHNFVPKADKFRTVPCKYYHSSQGCSKIDNCTFIHDERYAGVPVPGGQSTPSSAPMPSRIPSYAPYGNPPAHYYNPPPSNPAYYNPSMGYTPPYSNYGAPPSTYQSGYPAAKPPQTATSTSQPYSNPGYTQAQGYTPGGQSQGYGSGQGSGYPVSGQSGSGYATSGPQQGSGYGGSGGGQGSGYVSGQGSGYSVGQQGQYSNPNYQYYIGSNNPPK